MKRKVVGIGLALALALGGLAQEEAVPLGIIVEPPAGELTVRIWVDKPVYSVGETVRIHFELNRAAYVYIWDIMPDGRVHQIFPNAYEPQNYFPAGVHTIPSPGKGYQFRVAPPVGTEWLQIMASTVPIPHFQAYSPEQPFPLLSPDPQSWQEQLEAQVLGLVPEPAQRAFDFTCFQIVYGPAPGYGTLQVLTTPPLAKLYVDGVFRGYTPRTLPVTAGSHTVLIRKTGYLDYTTTVYILPGGTRTLNVTLTPVVINQPPVAQFTFAPASPRAGDWVYFDASASADPDGTIVNYQWDFQNDGVFDATGKVAFFRYTAPGTYTVRLVVTDDKGATASATKTVVVVPLVINQPPVARFAFTPESPRAGDWIQFDASASSDPDGTIVNYEWDFQDDGTFDATGKTVFFRYPTPGTYTVRLRVTDDKGATGTATKTVVVSPLVVNQPPVAVFTFSPAVPKVGQTVIFNGTASYDPDGTIVAYQWDLDGDGVPDQSGPVVAWAYGAAGAYTVTLTVTDNRGATGSARQTVVVQPLIPGMPPWYGIPGIFVWGTDRWYITVNGGPTWTTPRAFRIELRTDGEFVGFAEETGPAPLGLVPEPVSAGWQVVREGSVGTGSVTYSFTVRGATTIYFDLRLDMDGDGTPEATPAVARLRQRMVNPPTNPFVVGLPEGHPGPLVPGLNFRIGRALAYTQNVRIILWQTTIGALEGL
ncbi:MAG: PKD domain-containing protein [Candidatus Bipolaricaulota bacterium]|nr:PKD domain-containing protein [Candidatus Bipolaricaulota bacterium]